MWEKFFKLCAVPCCVVVPAALKHPYIGIERMKFLIRSQVTLD